jgi:integrase
LTQSAFSTRQAAAYPGAVRRLGEIIRPHGLRHTAITAALDETNGNVRAAREFSGHASIEVLMRYDDNRKDIDGEVAGKVVRRLAKLLE